MVGARWLVAASALSLLTFAAAARAQPPEAPDDKAREVAAKPPPESVDKKPVRSDEARGYETEPPTEPEDIALLVPRAVLAVPRYALKLVFWPVREGVRFVDKHALVEKVTDFLYNDARTAAVLPTFRLDSYFGPSFGLKAFHEDLAGHQEYGSVEARFGGVYQAAAQLHFRADRFGGSDLWLESLSRYESEPALLFQGIGNRDATSGGSELAPRDAAVATRFSQQRYLGLLRAGVTFGRPGEMLQLGVTGVYNVRDFGPKRKGDELSIEQVYDTSLLVGFDERVPTLETDINVIVDLRDVAGATASGAYLELFGGYVPRLGNYAFWHHGAELTGYVNLYRRTRVLVLRGVVEGVEGQDDDIPFSSLPRLGGTQRLRGYPQDRFRDEKVLVGTAEYRYPIHQYVAGALFLDAGRVARSYAALFDGAWQVGGGGGFVVRSRDRQLFAVSVAYGEGIHFHLTTEPLRALSERETEL